MKRSFKKKIIGASLFAALLIPQASILAANLNGGLGTPSKDHYYAWGSREHYTIYASISTNFESSSRAGWGSACTSTVLGYHGSYSITDGNGSRIANIF